MSKVEGQLVDDKMTRAGSTGGRSHFLALPTEIRIQIYRHSLLHRSLGLYMFIPVADYQHLPAAQTGSNVLPRGNHDSRAPRHL